MSKELAKTYNPSEVEARLYEKWETNKYFHADVNSDKAPFTIVMPPPNVTGQLHMGHALDNTLQDIIIRYKRMQGFEALWVPGTDHAGIATQIKVEESLRKEKGLTRHDIGRDKFIDMVWDWKKLYGSRITNQLRKIGSSCDWDRERFTLDDGCSDAVKEVFVNLYNKGLIYKGNRIINWCPHCATALSDAEVEHEEKQGNFWHIKYPVKDSDDFVIIATTRPETMLGDTAVAVNPDDERYKELVGKTLILPLVNREIPVIADDYVDKDFGTGCVKITPCHDPNDFEVGKRHNLEQILVLDNNAKIAACGGKYAGMDRYEARKQIIEDLDKLGLLVKIETVNHNVGTCYRCKTTVEPMTSDQWFVSMKQLAEPALKEVLNGNTKFIPERFTKIYVNWMENVHDWCISRQLWWGHRIPAYYCSDCGEMHVSKQPVEKCSKCGGTSIVQESDVLDTWFSSALWPFSTLGWPEKTKDLNKFYPTSVLVTGYDIIFFWVSRMIFSAVEHTGQVPFENVLIHGLVRDSQGRKMSKSLGNGIDPLEIIDQFGADALRFTLATGNSPGNDMRFYTERVEASRNFANKIWNAARFTLMNLTIDECKLPDNPDITDKWILTNYNNLVKEVTENLDKYEIGIAVSKLYDFIWDLLCDWYIELAKPRLFETNKDEESKINAQNTLCYVLSNTLKLLHPFMPFITEEIWCTLPHSGESIMISDFPKYDKDIDFTQDADKFEKIISLIRAVRNIRNEMNVPMNVKPNLYIKTSDKDTFEKGKIFIEKLAYASGVKIVDQLPDGVNIVSDSATISIPLDQLVDREKEIIRLQKEKGLMISEINRVKSKLSNEGFIAKAPQAVVDAEKEKAVKYEENLKNIEQSLSKLM